MINNNNNSSITDSVYKVKINNVYYKIRNQ